MEKLKDPSLPQPSKLVRNFKMNSRTEVYHVPQFDGPTSPKGMTRRLQEILDKASAAAFYRSFMDFTFKPHENRSNFDLFAAKLNGEANRWFHEAFSAHLRNRVKPFDSLVNLFQVRYMIPDEGVILLALQDVHTLLSEHASAISQFQFQNKTIDILVDRIGKLEHSLSKFDDQTAIIAELQGKNRNLESKLASFEEELAKISNGKNDTLKSLKDKQAHVQKEIAALKPMLDPEKTTLQAKVHSIEESCEGHRHLLDEVQLKVTALAEALEKPTSVDNVETTNTISHSAAKVSVSVNDRCDLCNSPTHSSSTCGARRLKCRQCYRVGHLARCCPQLNQQQSQCQRCGLHNHSSDQCGTIALQCWKCGRTGHLHRMCHQSVRHLGYFRIS